MENVPDVVKGVRCAKVRQHASLALMDTTWMRLLNVIHVMSIALCVSMRPIQTVRHVKRITISSLNPLYV